MKEQEYTVSTIKNNPGILYEAVGTLRITETSWKMIIYVDLTEFSRAVDTIQREIHTAFLRCKSIYDLCEPYKRQFNSTLNRLHKIAKYNQYLHGLIGTRIKRAPLEFIGEISKILFGTVTAEDARHILEVVKHVENKTDDLATLLINQTIATRARFGELYNATLKIKAQQEELYMHLRKTAATAIETATDTKTRLYFESIIENIKRTIVEHEIDLNVLIDAILFGKQGMIHPRLITPSKLIETARRIKDRIPNAEFPVPINEEEADHLIKISKLRVAYANSRIIYVLDIPLLNPGKYKLYRPVPLPAKQEFDHNKFAVVATDNEYIGLHEDADSFYELHEGEIRECLSDESALICPAIFPLKRMHQTPSCDVELLLNHHVKPKYCKIILRELKDTYWKVLHAPGNWAYSTVHKEQVRIECASFRGQFEIENSGILTIQQGCKIRTNSVTMSHPSSRTTKTLEHYIPLSNLSIIRLYEPVFKRYETNLSETVTEIWISNNSNVEATFDDIIEKAREIKNRKAQGQKVTLRNTIIYGLEIITLLAIIFLLACRASGIRKITTQLTPRRHNKRDEVDKSTPRNERQEIDKPTPLSERKEVNKLTPLPAGGDKTTNAEAQCA